MDSAWKKSFAIFMGGQTLSLFGSMLVQYAITWYITMTTQSGVMMTISLICAVLPTFFISPFGGVWADRYERKKLIALADGAIALVTLALAITFILGYKALWLLFLAQAVRALGAGIQTPAVSALLPQIVPKEELTRANGIFQSVQSAMMIVSPMAAGALMGLASIDVLFFIDVVTAAIAIGLLLAFLKVTPYERSAASGAGGHWAELKDGFAYIGSHPFLKRFFLFSGVFYFLIVPPACLTPLQVTRSFGNDVWRLTAVELAFSIGMMAGGALIAAWQGFRNRVATLALSCAVVGLTTLGLGLAPWFWLYMALMVTCGIAIPLFNAPATAMLQENVEPAFMGRVFGVLSMISSIMMPLGMILFGPAADVLPIEPMLVATGAAVILLSLSLLRSRVLRAVGVAHLSKATETNA